MKAQCSGGMLSNNFRAGEPAVPISACLGGFPKSEARGMYTEGIPLSILIVDTLERNSDKEIQFLLERPRLLCHWLARALEARVLSVRSSQGERNCRAY